MRRVIAVITLILTSAVPAGADIPTGELRLWMPFNGNANDESGNSHNGAPDGATLTEDRFGNPDSAYTFNGSDDGIDIQTSVALQPQLPVTLSAWIRKDNEDDAMSIFSNNFTVSRYTGVFMATGTDRFAAHIGDGGGTNPAGRRTKGADVIIEPGTWYHVAAVIRSRTNMTLFVNGDDVCGGYSGTGGSLAYNANDGAIGRQPLSSQYYFHGDIDDVALYGRALSAGEVLNLGGFDPDFDGDGVLNENDNCTITANASQLDADADGFGNACDPDLTNNGVINSQDLGLLRAAFFSQPDDNNWLPAADFNDDGVVNTIDLGVMKTRFFGCPGPSSFP